MFKAPLLTCLVLAVNRNNFALLNKASFPLVSRPASLEHGGWIPSVSKWRLSLLLRPRSGPGTASLSPHFVAQNESQIQREGK